MIKIIVIGALPNSLVNFRGELIDSLVSNGHQVIAMASDASIEEINQIMSLGVQYIDYSVDRNSLNPFVDLRTLLNFITVFKTEKPDVVLAYTIKPVIWGGVAARFFPQIKFYGLITGLGFAFQSGSAKRTLLTSIVTKLYRFALTKSPKVIFQNPDNLQVFCDKKIIKNKQATRVNGSGVDLSHFIRNTPTAKAFTFLTIARLLGEKGLREYAAAATIVKQQYPNVVFQLVGPADSSPDGIPIDEVNKWHIDGCVEYLGATADVRPYLAHCNVFVLASYHEGMPRTVLEAMATGRPILTTNVPGCRETVVDGENGFLVEKQNIEQLVEKICWFIENQDEWQVMADKSREFAIKHFDVHKVNEKIIDIMELKEQKEEVNV
ncbi:MAG: glycosyltransferase [Methylomarinum sp.]|nr:glycosyltransferase [Methylomarinum sp.]